MKLINTLSFTILSLLGTRWLRKYNSHFSNVGVESPENVERLKLPYCYKIFKFSYTTKLWPNLLLVVQNYLAFCSTILVFIRN